MLLLFVACAADPDDAQPVEDSEDAGRSCAVDVHEHFASHVEFSVGIETLKAEMVTHGVTHALVQTPPASGQSDLGAHYDFETDMGPSLKAAAAQNDELVLVAGGGILNPWIHSTAAQDAGAGMVSAFGEEAERILDEGAAGLGELAILHISYDSTHPFIEIDPEHPLMLEAARVAGRRGVPIDIHIELVDGADLAVSELPSACFRTEAEGGNNPELLQENRAGFEALLDANADAASTPSDAMVVWSHVGWDNTGHLDVDAVTELMAAHDNLVLSLKMLNEVGPCQVLENRPIDPDSGELREAWVALIEAYPDRVVIGGDEFFGDSSGSTAGSASLAGSWELVHQLSPELAEQVACTNPKRMWGL